MIKVAYAEHHTGQTAVSRKANTDSYGAG